MRLNERIEKSKEPGRVVQIVLTLLVFKATRMLGWAAQQAFSIAAVYLSARLGTDPHAARSRTAALLAQDCARCSAA